jgi:DNA-binding CsgD family transcriptional regulator
MSIRALLADEPDGASEAVARLGGDLDDALAALPLPVLVLSGDGVIRWLNSMAAELIGERLGHRLWSALAPESVHQARVAFAKHMIGGAQSSAPRLVMCSPDGTRSSVTVQMVPVKSDGRVVGVFGIAQVDDSYASPPPLHKPLTPRQQQILAELAHGASTEQIAASLGVSRETVRNHVRGLLRALQAHSRLEAVVEARRRGLVQ